MRNALVYTENPHSNLAVSSAVSRLGLPLRIVSSPYAAREWLRTQSFDVVVFDYDNKLERFERFFSDLWLIDPLTVGVIVRFGETIQEVFNYRKLGLVVVDGITALNNLMEIFKVSGRKTRDGQKSHAVMVVDDLDSPRFIISTLIQSFNFGPVFFQTSARDAFDVLRRRDADYFCVVTDLNMPDDTGVDLIRWLRAEIRTAQLPVVVLTAYSTKDNLIEALRAGASGFLVKPPRKQALFDELVKARRTFFNELSPRLCQPEDADKLEDLLDDYGEVGSY